MLVPHAAALPYRGDGVARALAQTFDGPVLPLPDDMMVLLNKIDKAEALSAPR